ncbi:hypothetical protein Syun_013537 [Stephania yunnanensis]|uniref:rhamnogalacturonan endolyase n=1 Tax=Stephania yunnanensis TaxID=152371 RepID=A0AAP0JJU4_9MAGN
MAPAPSPDLGDDKSRQIDARRVRLSIQDRHVVMDNGYVRVTLAKPHGVISEIYCHRSRTNLLLNHQKEDRRGYWDIDWRFPNGRGTFETIEGIDFSVVKEDDNQVELSFKRSWDPSNQNGLAPLNIDKRFVMLRGSHGFYSYEILEHLPEWPAFNIGSLRLTLKLNGDKFHYMAISDERRREMPTEQDRQRGQTLDYKEAVLLTNPGNPELRGQVDDKYQFATEAKDSHVHGWISDELKAGLWMITPSNEFRNGGPIKQELTSHLGPTMLAIFMSDHYLGNAELKFGDGEYWKKVLGPVFVYLNRVNDDSADARSDLWEDAKAQMRTEVQKWPYSFPVSGDFAHADQRGSVTGRLLVRDRFAPEELTPANSAYIGVAPPGEPGSWQTEGKGYQFWTRTDADGNFNISNVREGDYNLYGWVPGFIGDYTNRSNLHISPENEINLGDIVYEPPRDGPTLWEIGIPDRSAAEFFIPEPSPKYATKLSNAQSNSTDEGKFRQYGLWERYTELYPDNDLVYTVGVSDWRKDWFFAQVTRKNETDNSFEPTTWQVVFNLSEVVSGGTYKLRVAVAGATFANLQVRVNYPPTYRPLLETRMIGRDNAIARHGIHGEYKLYTADIPSYLLRPGSNTVYLYQNRNYGPFVGIMYDYLRLEAPTTAPPPPQSSLGSRRTNR